jgi:hypothetical protein
MKEEIIQEHYIQDIYRLDDGILLTVNKFIDISGYCLRINLKNIKKTKIEGIKNCYRINEHIIHWDRTYYKGSLFLDGHYIMSVANSEYEYKITCNTGIIGNKDYLKQINKTIKKIIDKY